MNIRELKIELDKYPDDMEVLSLLPAQGEGKGKAVAVKSEMFNVACDEKQYKFWLLIDLDN